jgi:hypothetical protein
MRNGFKDLNVILAWSFFNIVLTFAGMQMAFMVFRSMNALGSRVAIEPRIPYSSLIVGDRHDNK